MTSNIDSDDELVISKISDQIEIDSIEPIGALVAENSEILDIESVVKQEVSEEAFEGDFEVDLVEGANADGLTLEDDEEVCVKQEVQEFADIDDIATFAESDMQEVDISDFTESVEDSNLSDAQLYRNEFLQSMLHFYFIFVKPTKSKYGITPLPNQVPANPLKTGTPNEKYSCQVCDRRFKLKVGSQKYKMSNKLTLRKRGFSTWINMQVELLAKLANAWPKDHDLPDQLRDHQEKSKFCQSQLSQSRIVSRAQNALSVRLLQSSYFHYFRFNFWELQ